MSPVNTLRPADEAPWLLRKADAAAPRARSTATAQIVGTQVEDGDSAGNKVDRAQTHFKPQDSSTFLVRFIDRIGALLMHARTYWATANQRRIEDYLSQSTDLADCERRVRELDRNGWTMS